jgi:hypothetical protein
MIKRTSIRSRICRKRGLSAYLHADPPDDDLGEDAEGVEDSGGGATVTYPGKCPDCGDTLGEGVNCRVCMAVRLKRNSPGSSPSEVEEMILKLPGRRLGAGGCSSSLKPPVSNPKENLMKFPCPNPRANLDCVGTSSRKGKLCRSCAGIERRKDPERPRGWGRGQALAKPPAAAAVPAPPTTPPPTGAVVSDLVTIGPMPRHLVDVILVATRAVITGAKVESPQEAFNLGEASAYLVAALNSRN